MTSAFRYRAFGLSIASELALPAPLEPDPRGAGIDLAIRVGPLLTPPAPDDEVQRISTALQLDARGTDHWVLFAFGHNLHERFTASIRPGDVEVGWSAGIVPSDLAQHLVGVVLAAHAFVSGRVCLHGSAIRIGGRTLVILGDSGRGKSTLTAALVAGGAQLVTEEFITLGTDPRAIEIGVPAVKIGPAAAAVIGPVGIVRRAFEHADYAGEGVVVALDTAHLAPVGQTAIGEVHLLGARHAGTDALVSRPLATATAADALARAGYWMPFLPKAIQHRVMRAAFDIALSCPVRRLSLPDDLGALPRVAACLINRMSRSEG